MKEDFNVAFSKNSRPEMVRYLLKHASTPILFFFFKPFAQYVNLFWILQTDPRANAEEEEIRKDWLFIIKMTFAQVMYDCITKCIQMKVEDEKLPFIRDSLATRGVLENLAEVRSTRDLRDVNVSYDSLPIHPNLGTK